LRSTLLVSCRSAGRCSPHAFFSTPPSLSSLISFTSGGILRIMFGPFCKPNIDEQSPDPGLRESGTSLRRGLESTRVLSPIWKSFYQAAVDSEVRHTHFGENLARRACMAA